MPKSITRWENEAESIIYSEMSNALTPYVVDELTVVPGEVVRGPNEGIPEGQYEVRRTWNTVELAQNWIDTAISIGAKLGVTRVYTAVVE